MRVGINARLLASPDLRGWNRYTVNLLESLTQFDVDLYLYSDAPLHPAHFERFDEARCHLRVSPRMKYLFWEQYWLPKQCRADHVDLLHCPFNFGLPWRSPCPRVLTLHDAIDIMDRPRSPLRILNRLRPALLRTAAYHWIARRGAERIIAVSEHARGDLMRAFRIPTDRIAVVSEAADRRFLTPVTSQDRQRIRSGLGLTKPYVFYVGGWEDRKNVPFLVEAFAHAGLDNVELVLGGGREPWVSPIRELAQSPGVEDRIRLLPWVDDADLPALYAEALCFVYPSRYEGFGLQLCEAMAVGCPILAANATSLPEVLGDAGELFGLKDTGELTTLLRHVATDTAFRDDLAARSRRGSSRYCWTRTAEQTVAVYRSVMGKR